MQDQTRADGAGLAGEEDGNSDIERPAQSAQELSPTVTSACRAITALVTKLTHADEKIDQYKKSIGQHIATIKKARPDDWLQIVKTECALGRSSAYSYLALVNGTETVEGQRAKNRERVARYRSPLRNGQNRPVQSYIDEIENWRALDLVLVGKLAAAKNKIADLKTENTALKTENAALKIENAALRLNIEQPHVVLEAA